MTENKGFTPEELAQLKEYINESRKLKAQEPAQATEAEYNQAEAYFFRGEGSAPARFVASEPKDPITGETPFYDEVWERWNKKSAELNARYNKLLIKAIKASIGTGGDGDITSVIDTVRQIIDAAVEEAKTFSTIRQGTATNALTKVRSIIGENTEIDQYTGAATTQDGNLTITFPHFGEIDGLNTSTYRLLDAFTVALTESGCKSPVVSISLDEYMKKCELKDRKEARKQATKDLETLFDARISYKEKDTSGKPGGFADIRICDAKGINRSGVITFSFSQHFFNTLLTYPIMPYPSQLWRLSAKRNPNSYYLLRKIAEHKNMNAGKKNEDIISVKTLLAASPYMPKHTEVASKDRHFSRAIIDPFERDMNALEDTLTWEYCHSNNTPLTDDELQGFNYSLFQTLLIKTTWKSYPDQTARLARKAERQAAGTAKKGGKKPQKRG